MRHMTDREAAIGLIRNRSHLLEEARFIKAPSANRPNSTHVPRLATFRDKGDTS